MDRGLFHHAEALVAFLVLTPLCVACAITNPSVQTSKADAETCGKMDAITPEKKLAGGDDGRPIPPLAKWMRDMRRAYQNLKTPDSEGKCYRAEWGVSAFLHLTEWSPQLGNRAQATWFAVDYSYGFLAFSKYPILAVAAACGACEARADFSERNLEFSKEKVWNRPFADRLWKDGSGAQGTVPEPVKELPLGFRCEPLEGYGWASSDASEPWTLVVQEELEQSRCEEKINNEEFNEQLAIEYGPYKPWADFLRNFFLWLDREDDLYRVPYDDQYYTRAVECLNAFQGNEISIVSSPGPGSG